MFLIKNIFRYSMTFKIDINYHQCVIHLYFVEYYKLKNYKNHTLKYCVILQLHFHFQNTQQLLLYSSRLALRMTM